MYAGDNATVTAVFVANNDAGQVHVRVVPELAPYVTVWPNSFSSVKKGAQYSVQVTFAVPADVVPQKVDGTIQLRQSRGTLSRPLPISLEVMWPQAPTQNLGIGLLYPTNWYATPSTTTTSSSIFFTNNSELQDLEEIRPSEYCYFAINVLSKANPLRLSLPEWFHQHMRPILYDQISSEVYAAVAGLEAVQVTVSGRGGNSVYIYLLRGDDVLQVVYPLFAPQFLERYQAMIASLRFMP